MTAVESRSTAVTTSVKRGVRIVRIDVSSLMHESAIKQVETELLKQLPRASRAVVVDCEELTHHVSTEFLSTLVYVQKMAKKWGVTLALCNLSVAMLASYEVTALARLIPAFDSLDEAVATFGSDQAVHESPPEGTADRRAFSFLLAAAIAAAALAAWLAWVFSH